MVRTTGTYQTTTVGGEGVRAFVPYPLPPRDPALLIEGELHELHVGAMAGLERLNLAAGMVPSLSWFLYGFVRKEAVLSSQIEGTQATLEDVVTYEATHQTDRLADVEEVCNYIDTLEFMRATLHQADGLPLCVRLLCRGHERLMRGVRGADQQPGHVRRSQNWIGGSRPGMARFVPPPPDVVHEALGDLERWLHAEDALPPLVRAGLAHVQFETIHPFLDGNGRMGRLLIVLLLEHWALLDQPLLYLSVAFKRNQEAYYNRLDAVRREGDWEGWTAFFLRCIREAADDATDAARRLFHLIGEHRNRLVANTASTLNAVRLFEKLPQQPMITLAMAAELIDASLPTATKAVAVLVELDILRETTGKQRDRLFAYHAYLDVLLEDTGLSRL